MSTTHDPAVVPDQAPATTIASVYQAFADGDVPRLLGLLGDDVSFDAGRSNPSHAQLEGPPLLVGRHGTEQVAAFFAELGRCRVHEFVVHQLLESAETRTVAALITIDLTYPSGGRVHDDEVHVWTTDERGRVASLEHYVDTAKHLAGWRGSDRPE